MWYLQRIKDFMFTYWRFDHLKIMRYSNSDFVDCLDSRKFTFGYVFMLVGVTMLSKNVKQSLIATSTMEENFIACYEVSNQGIWLRNFINKLRIVDGIERLLSINCDNKNAKLYSKNNITSSKLKHSDIRFLVVKEIVQSLQVSIDHISTNFFITEGFTTQSVAWACDSYWYDSSWWYACLVGVY